MDNMTHPAEAPRSLSQMTALTGIVALLLGVFADSFAAIFIRLSELELGPYATISHRFWIATLAIALWVGFKHVRQHQTNPAGLPSPSLTSGEWVALLAAGAIVALEMCLWALSMGQTSVANAVVLGNLSPLFTTLGAWLLWRQGFDRRFLAGLTLALGGAFTIGLEDFHLVPSHTQGDVIALLSAVFFGIYLLTLERLRERLSASMILLWCSATASLVSAVIAICFEDQFFPISWQGWLAVLGLALISQTIGQGLVTYSLSQLSSGIVAVTFLLEPLIAASVAWVLFAETLSILNGVGFTLVIVGIYVAISSQSALKQASH